MAAVGRVVPVLPVSLVAAALLEEEGSSVGTFELHARTQGLMRRLAGRGAHVYLPRADEEYAVAVGLRMLVQRHLVEERSGGWVPVDGELPLLRYYASSLRQLL
jgi:glycerol-3-phosphate O-acyltransferase